MNQTAANLIDKVLPAVPVRQWVLSFPMPLRFWLARRPALRKVVLGIFVRVVFSWARHQARLAGHEDPQFGAVCFHQMFGSSLNLNLHFHLLALDGYYSRASPRGELQFRPTPAPTTEDIQRLVNTIRRRVTRALVRRGFFDSSDEEPEEDALFAIQAASSAHRVAMGTRAGRKVRKLKYGSQRSRKLPRLCAESGYFNLHAAVRIDAQDRVGLERLCRYVTRPPLSHSRLRQRDDGLLSLRLKTQWSDGTSHIVLSELELVEKLAAIVPTPRANLVTYHGVLASAAKCRSQVVPGASNGHTSCTHAPHQSYIPWADLLKRTFGVDALRCPRCSGRFQIRAVVRGAWVAGKLLGVLGLPAEQQRLLPARGPPSDDEWM